MAEFNLEGLLGNIGSVFSGGGNYLDEYLTPEQRRMMQRNAMLAASAALLKAGGESTRRIGIGEALGEALQAGQGGYEKAQTGALTQMALKQKMDEAKRAKELQKMIAGVFTPQTATPSAAPVDAMLPPSVPKPMPKVGDTYPYTYLEGDKAGTSEQRTVTQADLDAASNYKGPQVKLPPELTAPTNRVPTALMNPNVARANQYRQAAQMLNVAGQGEQAMKYEDMAEKLDPQKTSTGTALSKLIAERNALPVGSSLIPAYDAAIEKESKFAPSDKAKLLADLGLAPTVANLRLLEKPDGPSDKAKLLAELGLPMTLDNLQMLESSPNELRLLKATGTPVTLQNVMKLKASGAASTTVTLPPQEKSFETGLGIGQAKQAMDSKLAAQAAVAILETNRTGRIILNSGAITGTGANFLVGFNNALKQAGIDAGYADAAANSQAYAAAMGANVGQLIKQFGAGTGLSDADREFAMLMAGGKITLTEQALRKILDINDKAANKVIDTHNKTYANIKTNIPLAVENPVGAAPPPPPPAASQIPGGAPAANLSQQRQEANAAIARGAPAAAVRQRFKQNTGQEL